MKHLLRRMKRRIFRKDKQLSDKSFHLPFYLFLYSYDFYTKKFYCNEINPRCDQSNWDSWERSRLVDWEYGCWVPAPKSWVGLGGKPNIFRQFQYLLTLFPSVGSHFQFLYCKIWEYLRVLKLLDTAALM